MPLTSATGPAFTIAMRSIHRLTFRALLSVGVLVQARDATAQANRTLELDWQGPPSCPQQAQVTEQIQAILGAAPGATLPFGLRARGMIEPIDGRFQLTLTVRVGAIDRSRVIESDDCGSLGKAAAVVLGLLIRRTNESGRELSDSDLAGAFGPASNLSDPTPKKISPPPPARPPPPRDHATRRDWQVLVMAPLMAIDYQVLPNIGYGLGAAAGFARNRWRGFLVGTFWLTQHQARGGAEPYEATFSRKSFEAWGCRGWRQGYLEVTPCALGALDVISASASGDRFSTKPQIVPTVSAGAGLVGYWHLSGSASLVLSTTGRIAPYRTQFVARGMLGASDAHTVPLGTMAAFLGAEFVL